MALETRTIIKGYFETGDTPTQAQFINLIDSALWYSDYSSNHSVLVANTAGTVVPVTLATNQVLGRKAAGYVAIPFEDVMLVDQAHENIGFNNELKSYTYAGINAIDYPAKYSITIDSTLKYIGEPADQTELLVLLNALGLGTFSVVGTELRYEGFHIAGPFLSSNELDTSESLLAVDTTDATAMLNIFGSTAFDLSIENSLVGNTDLITSISNLNFTFLAFPTGAVINWWHPGGGDGWGSISADATDRGLDYTTVQGGDLYNGGSPYGRVFFDEYLYLLDEVSITKAIVGLNIASALIPSSGALIDWDLVDYEAVKAEIDDIITGVATTSASIYIWELGMELITNSFEDLTANPGGAETTKAQVLKKLLTYTNPARTPALTVSIIDYLQAETPGALISIDGRLWDDYTSHDSDWISVLSSIDGVDLVRQYYQFKDEEAVNYAAVRAKVADRTDFWHFIEDADFNGKKTFISQFTVKATSPVRNTVANGLLMAEMYMVMTHDNLLHGNLLQGMCHMNIKQLFDVGDDYSHRVHYPFVKQLGEFFDDSQDWVDVVATRSEVAESLVVKAVQVGAEIRIAVLNPTATAYELDGITIDGVDEPTFSVEQNYSTDPTNPLTTGVTNVTEAILNFRPHSFSVITIS